MLSTLQALFWGPVIWAVEYFLPDAAYLQPELTVLWIWLDLTGSGSYAHTESSVWVLTLCSWSEGQRSVLPLPIMRNLASSSRTPAEDALARIPGPPYCTSQGRIWSSYHCQTLTACLFYTYFGPYRPKSYLISQSLVFHQGGVGNVSEENWLHNNKRVRILSDLGSSNLYIKVQTGK